MTRKKTFPNLAAYLAHLEWAGVTQGEFAAKMGISEGYLSDLKNGRQHPSLPLAKRLADEAGIPIESFLSVEVRN